MGWREGRAEGLWLPDQTGAARWPGLAMGRPLERFGQERGGQASRKGLACGMLGAGLGKSLALPNVPGS